MRAILLLSLVAAAACGSRAATTFELDIGVDAPQAASALVDGEQPLAADRRHLLAGFPIGERGRRACTARSATLDADGSVRVDGDLRSRRLLHGPDAAAARRRCNFVEALDASGAPMLALESVECEKTDGTGTVVMP